MDGWMDGLGHGERLVFVVDWLMLLIRWLNELLD